MCFRDPTNMKLRLTRSLLLHFNTVTENGCNIRSLHHCILRPSDGSKLFTFRFAWLMRNMLTNLNTRQHIFTSYQLLSEVKIEKPLCLSNGDESYFDFKELECNASAERRIGHFIALMCEIFQMSEEEAEDIVQYYPFLWKEFFHKTFTHLKTLKLEKTTFMQYPWLISMSTGMCSNSNYNLRNYSCFCFHFNTRGYRYKIEHNLKSISGFRQPKCVCNVIEVPKWKDWNAHIKLEKRSCRIWTSFKVSLLGSCFTGCILYLLHHINNCLKCCWRYHWWIGPYRRNFEAVRKQELSVELNLFKNSGRSEHLSS